jgi:hypothetical protein
MSVRKLWIFPHKVQLHLTTLKINTCLVELSYGKYSCAMVMFSKKNIFGNWIEEKCVGIIVMSINYIKSSPNANLGVIILMPWGMLEFVVHWA